MKMRILLPALLAVVLTVAAVAQTEPLLDEPAGEDPDRYKYVVKRGDTLWDLASRFLDDPFKWPHIWQQNQHIEDPHWIYPGDVLTIVPEEDTLQNKLDNLPVEHIGGTEYAEAAGAEDEEFSVTWTAPTAESDRVIYTPAHKLGFMSGQEIESTAIINDAPESKAIYGTYDKVYINAGKNRGFKVGDKFDIFRAVSEIRHPITNKKVGKNIRTIGTLKIIKVDGTSSEAEIISSNESVILGDHITPMTRAKTQVMFCDIDARYYERPLEGYIILSQLGNTYTSKDEIVYIDVGKKHGVVPGNLFNAYLPRRRVKDPETGEKMWLPEKTIGKLVVMTTSQNFSTALIIQSIQEFKVGEHVRSKRFTDAR